jgi:hypothetical protein
LKVVALVEVEMPSDPTKKVGAGDTVSRTRELPPKGKEKVNSGGQRRSS